MKKTLRKNIEESLSKSHKVVCKIEESKKLKESMRRDFYDWYDSLTDYARKRFDDYMSDEGYPDMVTDLSNQDIEYLMMEFNPDYFEEYDESCDETIKESIDTSDFSKVDKDLYDGVPEEAFMNLPDGSPALDVLDDNGISSYSWIISGNNNGGCTIWYIDDDTVAHKDYGNLPIRKLVSIINSIDDIRDEGFIDESKKVRKESKKSPIKKSLKEGKLHPFTKNDWYGYAGAEKFPDGSDPLIYSDPETDDTIIVSYDNYTDDIIVQAIFVDDEGEGISFTKTYQGDRQKAITDAEDIISKGWLSTGDTNDFGPDWERGIG